MTSFLVHANFLQLNPAKAWKTCGKFLKCKALSTSMSCAASMPDMGRIMWSRLGHAKFSRSGEIDSAFWIQPASTLRKGFFWDLGFGVGIP